jgi:hypothetical protein
MQVELFNRSNTGVYKMTEELLPCPFCGDELNIEPWHGGKPTKMMISCHGLYANSVMGRCNGAEITCEVAPIVTGETREEAIRNWNTRAQPKYKRVDLDELKTGDLPPYYAVEDMLKAEGHDEAIDDIKSKYGDLYYQPANKE